ncbi:MAG: hypothetical protein GF313_14515, partial [Caldithrix sp.]|nr:hypothetical protein [Caldithrix sp.]
MGLLITALLSCQKSTGPDDTAAGPDTTSHAFEWQIYEFPVEERIVQNYFWDIFAASDTNVWAVGQVYTDEKDSAGEYLDPYNA